MITTRIKELADTKGITTAYQLQKAAELSPSMAARLYKDDVEMIALRTVESLCKAFDCNPGDLFVYSSTENKKTAKAKKTKK